MGGECEGELRPRGLCGCVHVHVRGRVWGVGRCEWESVDGRVSGRVYGYVGVSVDCVAIPLKKIFIGLYKVVRIVVDCNNT